MGYVTESRGSTYKTVQTKWTRLSDGLSVSRDFGPFQERNESQYGFRSGALSAAEVASYQFLDKNGSYAKEASMLEALDRIQAATTPVPHMRGGGWDVHYRTYNSWDAPVGLNSSNGTINPIVPFSCKGAARIEGITYIPSSPRPSAAEVQGAAGQQMRDNRPVRPDANITRFIGELKDSPKLGVLTNYLPAKGSELGGAYLNAQFGIMPTASDLHNMSEAVLKADKLTKQFVQDSAYLIRKSSKRIVLDETVTARGSTIGSLASYSDAGVNFRADFGYPGSTYQGPGYTARTNFKREVRASATFEHFVGDPNKYTARMDSYTERAQKMLGVNLDESTIYALTPWTWMLDWFVDIGSLVDYQQTIADYSLVMRRGSAVLEETSYSDVVFDSRYNYGSGGYYIGSPMQITAIKRYQQRYPGSPYDMSPTWNLNGFQWSIVGALGLTRAPRVAHIIN